MAKHTTVADFMVAWEEVARSSEPSIEKVAEKLNISVASVKQRAKRYREKYNLPLSEIKSGPRGKRFDLELAKKVLEEIKNR